MVQNDSPSIHVDNMYVGLFFGFFGSIVLFTLFAAFGVCSCGVRP